MSIWLLQTLLNIMFCYWLFLSIRSRQRLQEMEERVAILEDEIRELGHVSSSGEKNVDEDEKKELSPALAEGLVERRPTQQVSRTVSQSELIENKSSSFGDLYSRAASRLEKGEKAEDVAKDSGLSLSELRLLAKVSRDTSLDSAT